MRQRLQQEDNRLKTNQQGRPKKTTRYSRKANSDLLKEMRKEMDELRNAIKEKIDRSLDRMVRRTGSPFTMAVLAYLVPSKFRLSQLKPFNRLKDPLDHLNTFKTTLGLQQPPDKILRHSFPTTLKGAAREWFTKLPTSSIDNFEQLGSSFLCHFVGEQRPKRPAGHLGPVWFVICHHSIFITHHLKYFNFPNPLFGTLTHTQFSKSKVVVGFHKKKK